MARVLIIEDDPVSRRVLSRIVLRSGFHVKSAATVEAAKKLDTEFDPDLLLVDWQLPDGSGLALAHEIRRRKPGAGVVLMTGFPTYKISKEIEQTRPERILEKPFNSDDLRTALRAVLGESGPPP